MSNFVKQWEKAATRFTEDQDNSEYAVINKAIVKKRFQKLNCEKVLDLGCGYGYYTDHFRNIGGNVIGIDGAKTMISIAKNRYPKSTFFVHDIMNPFLFEDESFDIVFCNQVLMDVENIENLFRECYRILKKGGIFYFSIIHPAFYNGDWVYDEKENKFVKQVTSYITSYDFDNNFWGKTRCFHRPLSYYLNTASDTGFFLTHSEEPKSYNNKMKNEDIPLFFFAEYKKL